MPARRSDDGTPGGTAVGPAPVDGRILDRVRLERRVADLEREVAQLRQAVEARAQVAVAVGVLVERYHCGPEQAWALLARLSQNTNTKVRDVARVLVAVADGSTDAADRDLAAELDVHLRAGRPRRARP